MHRIPLLSQEIPRQQESRHTGDRHAESTDSGLLPSADNIDGEQTVILKAGYMTYRCVSATPPALCSCLQKNQASKDLRHQRSLQKRIFK